MFTKKSIFRMSLVLLVVLMMSSTASAQPLAAAFGTGFTYQGKLSDGGAPANGSYDFQFTLYDVSSGGNQVGSTVTKEDISVTDGLFTVQLDFGNVFDGTALYLEIGVRPGSSTGAYTTLTPRQLLTATPYANYAANAPWSGLTGVPAGFADGVDNDTTYTAGKGLQLAGTQFSGKGSPYQNVIIVAKSGGDYTSIQAAINSISDASNTNRYLIYVAPGVYTEQVTMYPYVDIQGSGELTTKITWTGSTTSDSGTVYGASNAELRYLTVENTGGSTVAVAILNYYTSPRLTHITASAFGNSSQIYGIRNVSASTKITDSTVTGSGGSSCFGVVDDTSSWVVMKNVTVSASGGSTGSDGVFNRYSTTTIQNSTISGSDYSIWNNSGTTHVGSSELDGPSYDSSGILACAGVYNESYTFYASTCP